MVERLHHVALTHRDVIHFLRHFTSVSPSLVINPLLSHLHLIIHKNAALLAPNKETVLLLCWAVFTGFQYIKN